MNKNFLVTGASGFIASHIADYLTKECEAAQVEGCNELRKDFETDLIKMRNEMTTIQNEIKELEAELTQVRAKMASYLKELGV